MHNVCNTDSLATCVLGVHDRILDEILEERLEHPTRLFVDKTREPLDATAPCESTDGLLGDALKQELGRRPRSTARMTHRNDWCCSRLATCLRRRLRMDGGRRCCIGCFRCCHIRGCSRRRRCGSCDVASADDAVPRKVDARHQSPSVARSTRSGYAHELSQLASLCTYDLQSHTTSQHASIINAQSPHTHTPYPRYRLRACPPRSTSSPSALWTISAL